MLVVFGDLKLRVERHAWVILDNRMIRTSVIAIHRYMFVFQVEYIRISSPVGQYKTYAQSYIKTLGDAAWRHLLNVERHVGFCDRRLHASAYICGALLASQRFAFNTARASLRHSSNCSQPPYSTPSEYLTLDELKSSHVVKLYDTIDS